MASASDDELPAWHSSVRHETPTRDDFGLTALRRIHRAMQEAGLWPNGVRLIDEQGRLSMQDTLLLLRANGVTLITSLDLGEGVRGVLLYPTRTIIMNARYYAQHEHDPMRHLSLIGTTCTLLSLLLVHPPYTDTLTIPLHFERTHLQPEWPIWHTGVWLAIVMLLPAPMVYNALNASVRRGELHLQAQLEQMSSAEPHSASSGVFRRAIQQLAETRQLPPELVELKTHAVTRGAAEALSASHYTAQQRAQPWFPFDTLEMARAQAEMDTSHILSMVAKAIDTEATHLLPVVRIPESSRLSVRSSTRSPARSSQPPRSSRRRFPTR